MKEHRFGSIRKMDGQFVIEAYEFVRPLSARVVDEEEVDAWVTRLGITRILEDERDEVQ